MNWQTERLGRFESEEAAARVYDERVKARRDPFVLSFLPNGSLNPDRKKRRRVPAGQQPASAPAAEGNEHAVASEEQAKPNGGGVEAL